MQFLSDFYRSIFSCKVYKIALDSTCTCPNRDGSKGRGGCIFCSQSGSGDFVPDKSLHVSQQVAEAKERVLLKLRGRSGTRSGKFIAYFQNYSATYGNAARLKTLWLSALSQKDVAGLALATRPDCLNDEILFAIKEISRNYFVQIELGLQTSNEITGQKINRCFSNEDYADAVLKLRALNPKIHVVTHLIFGLPDEGADDMMESVKFVAAKNSASDSYGIKITSLYVVRGTQLSDLYGQKKYAPLSKAEYLSLLQAALPLLGENCVVHRLTGDPPKKILIAPDWTSDKMRVMNEISRMKKI